MNRHELRKSQRKTGITGLSTDQKAARSRNQRRKMKLHKRRFHLN